jgi:hypothetical protein
MANAVERRCKSNNRRGERCAARVVNAAGYCVAHDPEKPADMRALGKRSAESRRKPNPDRVRPSLRQYLVDTVEPSEVWAALKLAMEGANESARVQASRVLIDALAELKQEQERGAEYGEARERLAQLLAGRADRKKAAIARGERNFDVELERAVAERTADLTRERDEALARLAEFQTA